MLEHQNEHFVRDFLKFHTSQLQNRCFPTSFLLDLYLKIDVSYEGSVDFHHMSQNATPAGEFAPCHHTSCSADNAIRKNNATRHVDSAAPPMQNDIGGLQGAVPATKNATLQKYCVCHGKLFLTRHATCCNVTNCHACHVKRSDATLKNLKNAPCCRTYHRHGHSDLAGTVADGWATSGEHSSTPRPPE